MFKLSKDKDFTIDAEIFQLFPNLKFKAIFVEEADDHFGIMIQKDGGRITVRNCDTNESSDLRKVLGKDSIRPNCWPNIPRGNMQVNPLLSQETLILINFYLENVVNYIGRNY